MAKCYLCILKYNSYQNIKIIFKNSPEPILSKKETHIRNCFLFVKKIQEIFRSLLFEIWIPPCTLGRCRDKPLQISRQTSHSCDFHHTSQSSAVRSAHKQLKQQNQESVVVVSGYITASPKNMK